jgi:ketosteroid isomerase-like protein
MKLMVSTLIAAVCSGLAPLAYASPDDDRKTVAALDTEFQQAVKRHDVATIERILHEDMILVLGDGRTVSRNDIVQSARDKRLAYEQQDEDEGTQVVRVWGDTAVVTARLWVKGVQTDGTRFDRRLWFSDTYVRTRSGWKYVFGQASLKIPDLSPH